METKRKNGNQHTVSKILVGDSKLTKEGCKIVVLQYKNWSEIQVEFQDDFKYKKWVNGSSFVKGSIKNPYHRTLYGIGYIGVGENRSKVNKVATKAYTIWRNMFIRCYDEKYQQTAPNYIGMVVCEDWHNFQNFAEWLKARPQYDLINNRQWSLDKDILGKNSREYSPNTARLVPTQINSFITTFSEGRNFGIRIVDRTKPYYVESCGEYVGLFASYEEAKLAHKTRQTSRAIELSEIWKEVIDEDVYQALRIM